MKKHKFIVFFIFGFLILLIILLGYGYITEGRTEDETITISVLVYGNDTERWTSLKQGAEQAEKDYNLVLNYVTTSMENSPQEQKEQIKREIENGAQGLIIAACDSRELEETVAELIQKVPIVMIETGVNSVEASQYLTADNYKMGKSLAEAVDHDDLTSGNVAVISQNLQRDSVVERSKGFADNLNEHDIVYLESVDNMELNQSELRQLVTEHDIDTVVALDNNTLENLVDLVEAGDLDSKIYGIGNTDKVVYYLDKGVIRSIVFQNEFSMGYLGAEQLYNKIANEPIQAVPEIPYRVIDKNTMYTQENQRLLFPLVQ